MSEVFEVFYFHDSNKGYLFFRNSLKDLRVLDCLASNGKLYQICRVVGKKGSLYWFVLARVV